MVDQYAREWGLKQAGAATVHHGDPARFSGDIAIVNAAELPLLVESGRFVPVPDSIIKSSEHPYQWDGLLRSFAGPMVSWGGVEYGLPLIGDGHVLVYRKDRLAESKIEPPVTWEELVASAQQLAKPDRSSMPPMPKRAIDLETEFHLIAGCYDRKGLSQGDVAKALKDINATDQLLSYHYRLSTGEARIDSPAFVYALNILRQMQACRPAGESEQPWTSFADGNATFAVLSLRDLYRLQHAGREIQGKFGIAPIPGSRFTFDPVTGERVPMVGNVVNRIPYLGARTVVGLVSKDCADPAQAWEFLIGLALPERTGAEVITAGEWGAGPFRYFHIEERGRHLWFGYDLPRDETENLIAALKLQLQPSIVNHCYRLRLPNSAGHEAAFDTVIRSALISAKFDAKSTVDELSKQWSDLWKGVPKKKQQAWVRQCYGLPGE